MPNLVVAAGPEVSRRFMEFFLVSIRNPNTRSAYAGALKQFFLWCDDRGLLWSSLSPLAISAYIEQHPGAPQTVNQHLAAIKSLFSWMVQGGVLTVNPAAEVKGVQYRTKVGKTTVLSDEEMRALLGAIETSDLLDLRDRALIATMFFSFARISAVLGMKVEDYFQKGGKRRFWLRLHEKGGRYHEVPAHHRVEEFLDAYLEAGELWEAKGSPLFRSAKGRARRLSERALSRHDALVMVKRRSAAAGICTVACNHTFRASGITNYLKHGGSLDNAQKIAAHEDSRTTALYDRRDDSISLDEIERIRL